MSKTNSSIENCNIHIKSEADIFVSVLTGTTRCISQPDASDDAFVSVAFIAVYFLLYQVWFIQVMVNLGWFSLVHLECLTCFKYLCLSCLDL